MLETGTVREKNQINILYKNILDGAVAAFGFWFIGYMFAYGSTAGGFIGIQSDLIFCQSIQNNAGAGGSGLARDIHHLCTSTAYSDHVRPV